MARKRRSTIDLRSFDLGAANKRPDLNFYERALMVRGVIPKSYLLKKAPRRAVDAMMAEWLVYDLIEVVKENDVEFIIPIGTAQPKPMRKGRFIKAEHPDHYNPASSRPKVSVPLLRRDRNLLWYLGDGRIGEGAQAICHWFRKTMNRDDYPDIPEDVL